MDMLQVFATGRLTKDPEWKNASNGTKFLVFTVAAENGWGDNKVTTFLDCSYFGKAAEGVAEYLSKGSPVSVVGEFQLRKWESDKGKGMNASCRVSSLVLLPKGNRSSEGSAEPQQKKSASGFTDDIPF